jgi:DNA-binding beta-propeller fold protein YncE
LVREAEHTCGTATIAGGNTGLNNPVGIVLDAAGNIYVGNSDVNSITVYAAGANGNATPTATIAGGSTGLNGLWAITF